MTHDDMQMVSDHPVCIEQDGLNIHCSFGDKCRLTDSVHQRPTDDCTGGRLVLRVLDACQDLSPG